MSARIALDCGHLAAGVEMRSTMINTISAMHVAMWTKRRPEDQSNFRVEVKKRRPKPDDNEEEDRPRPERTQRGYIA